MLREMHGVQLRCDRQSRREVRDISRHARGNTDHSTPRPEASLSDAGTSAPAGCSQVDAQALRASQLAARIFTPQVCVDASLRLRHESHRRSTPFVCTNILDKAGGSGNPETSCVHGSPSQSLLRNWRRWLVPRRRLRSAPNTRATRSWIVAAPSAAQPAMRPRHGVAGRQAARSRVRQGGRHRDRATVCHRRVRGGNCYRAGRAARPRLRRWSAASAFPC